MWTLPALGCIIVNLAFEERGTFLSLRNVKGRDKGSCSLEYTAASGSITKDVDPMPHIGSETALSSAREYSFSTQTVISSSTIAVLDSREASSQQAKVWYGTFSETPRFQHSVSANKTHI